MNPIVLDLETQKSFAEVGRTGHAKMRISVAGIYDYGRDAYEAFEERDIHKAVDLVQSASLVIGFNVRRFDFPVFQPYLPFPIAGIPTLDLLDAIEKERGHRATLESVARGTLGEGKSGSGLDAIKQFREGKIEELKKYCLDDVRITKEVYEYGKKHGEIFFISNRDWKKHRIPVSWGESPQSTEAPPEEEFPTSLF